MNCPPEGLFVKLSSDLIFSFALGQKLYWHPVYVVTTAAMGVVINPIWLLMNCKHWMLVSSLLVLLLLVWFVYAQGLESFV